MGDLPGNQASIGTTGKIARQASEAVVGAFSEEVPAFSIVIPTRERLELLLQLLERLHQLQGPSREVIVVDDASHYRSCDVVRRRFPQVRVLRNERSRGFDSLPDAVDMARGKFVLQLDDDAYPAEDTLERLEEHFEARGEQLAMVAMPFIEPESGRIGYSPYLPEVPEGATFAPARGYIAGAVAVRREAASEVPLSPQGYFMYQTEVPTAIEYLRRGWEIDYLPAAKVFHLWEANGRKAGERQAYLSLRNDLVTINRYFSGWRRLEMLAGRYISGFFHLLTAGSPRKLLVARNDALEMLTSGASGDDAPDDDAHREGAREEGVRERGVREAPGLSAELSPEVQERVYKSFDGLTVLTLLGETNRRRLAWYLGRLPVDQSA